MIVRNFTTNDVPSLKTTDTVQYALLMMDDFSVRNLPIVDNGKLLGYALFLQLESLNPDMLLSELNYGNQPVSIDQNFSVIKGLQLLSNNKFDVLAVTDDNSYTGLIWSKDIIHGLGQSTTAQSDGSVLLLRCNVYNYSISEIGRLIEAEDGKLLGLWTWQPEGNQNIDVLLKLNIRHIDNICQILQSNGYTLLNQINMQSDDVFDERYKSLINYLDI
ncbi:MAG: acetoin utilization protein AcuB [Bacteroidia bacterium]|jgi:acetoin utilization protein AcuB